MWAMPSLGAGKRGQMVSLGFPLMSLRLLFGVSERIDVGAGFDTFTFTLNEPRLVARWAALVGPRWSLGASAEVGYAFFTVRAARESQGARWFTGRRNVNISPALVLSYQASKFRAARLFAEMRYALALDTQPYTTEPLGGVPQSVIPGHNVGIKVGAELPLSPAVALAFHAGVDVHGRQGDSPLMPTIALGLITSL